MEDNGEQLRCIRCVKCNKLLGKVPINTNGEIEMKCPRCEVIYKYRLDGDKEK